MKALSFDRPLADLLKPDWEKALYFCIFLLAVASRFWHLGMRAMSFDECTHTLYSYNLYNGSGYTHDPMMHGPFLFHANALIYVLLGDNDYTSRIVPALFGVFLVMSPLLLRRWLGRAGAMITSILLLISPVMLYYSRYIRDDIYMAAWTMLLTAALFHFLEDRKPGWFYLGAAVLMLSLATMENAYFFGFIGLVFIAEVLLWEKIDPRHRRWLYAGGAAVSLLLLGAAYLLGRPPAAGEEAAATATGMMKILRAFVTVVGGSLPAVLISATLIHSRHPWPSRVEGAIRSLRRRDWLVAVVLMFLIYTLLFTAFFTSPIGMATGIPGSLSYWLAQQDVQRGGQPWYYYLLLLIMYEFLPLLLGLVGLGTYLVRGPQPRQGPASKPENAGHAEDLPAAPTATTVRSDAPFVCFLILWMLVSLFIYGWAGEKMPWLAVHQVLPLIVLAGKFAGDLFGRLEWRSVWQRSGAWLALLLPSTLLVLLSFFTVRFAWMASYINYDYATELLVYAHGTPDVTRTMDEIAEISRRTVGDKRIEVAYDQEAAWPLEWYMREYPNRKFYGDTPTREALNVPIVLASDDIDAKVRPFLGDRYDRFRWRELWWPNQQYMGLTGERIRNILTSPEKRKILWNILYWRKYPRTAADWYHVDYSYLYVRKDVAQQLWDYGAAPPEAYELPPDPYAEAHVDLPSTRVWGDAGTAGTGPGQFNHPRGIAVGPDGNVYVVDSDNHRVQVFDANGTFLRQWGSSCNLATGLGCVDPDGSGPLETGDGQFQEPWGIAVAGDGRVYVTDTWNHRIQVFDAHGTFLAKWGTYGQTADASWLFYGPRDVAVDPSGQVFITDTGNKRVVVFDQEGNYLRQWGSEGAEPGQLKEPVGIAVDANGAVYVADTWNQRVQVFDGEGTSLRQWRVEAWFGESVVNKPYLALDGQGRVYVTDPEGYRVAVFGAEGDLLVTFGLYGYDDNSFSLPTGIDVDAAGAIYVTDTDGQRVIKFEPLP